MSQCDEVIFLDQGKVLDQDKHATLLERNEQYASLISTFLQENENTSGEETTSSSSEVELLNVGLVHFTERAKSEYLNFLSFVVKEQ